LTDSSSVAVAASLIVVNYQGGPYVARCLESLTESPGAPFEMFIVDNASTDGSLELIERFARGRDDVRVVRSERNLGYAGAVNLVLDRCRGRYVGVCNMDLLAEPGWLAPLVQHLDDNPRCAAVNPVLLLMDGTRINAAGLHLHVSGLGFNNRLGEVTSAAGEAPFPISGIHGAVFLCRADVLARMGGLDDRGFLYHEDVRLSWAIRAMGLGMACVPASRVRHEYRLSMHPEKLYLLERNRWTLLRDALGGSALVRILPGLLATEALLLGYATLRGPRFLAAKLRAVRHALGNAEDRVVAKRAWKAQASRSERQVLAGMSWRYEWRQFVTLAGERGAPRRPFEAPR